MRERQDAGRASQTLLFTHGQNPSLKDALPRASPGALQRMRRKKEKRVGPPRCLAGSCGPRGGQPGDPAPAARAARDRHAASSAAADAQPNATLDAEQGLGEAPSDAARQGRGGSSGGQQRGDKTHSPAGAQCFFVKINLFSEEKLPMDLPMLAKAVSSPAFSRWIDLGH